MDKAFSRFISRIKTEHGAVPPVQPHDFWVGLNEIQVFREGILRTECAHPIVMMHACRKNLKGGVRGVGIGRSGVGIDQSFLPGVLRN